MKKDKVLLIYTSYSTFVAKDFIFLQKHFKTEKYLFKPEKGIKISLSLLKQFLFLILHGWKFEHFIIWFADFHSFMPIIFSKILKRKSYLIIGGYDATGIKEINYGIFYSNKIRKFLNKISIKYAKFILPVDKSLILGTNNYAKENSSIPVGIKSIVPYPKGKIIELPTGYDYNFWKRDNTIKRRNDVMSVASIYNFNTWKLKGGDLLLDIAKLSPEIDFHFYGIKNEFLSTLKNKNIPKNFYLHGYINNKELPKIYSKHKVYAQFSLSEGLPNVLCEAMLCECIPVGSNVNGIPNAIGNEDFILKERNAYKGRKIILKAINSKSSSGEKFRKRIIYNFNQDKRENTLKNLIKI